MVSNLLYYLLITICIVVLFIVLKPIIDKYLYRLRLESEFLDFLSILLTLEASGLRLDNVLEEASKCKLILPNSFINIVKKYSVLSRLNPDPYTCIRVLSREIPSTRVSGFFRGYSEVLISSNDTLSYVESFIKEELKSIESRIASYVSILDSIYEAFLIILLGVVVYSIIPVVYINPIFFSIVLSIASITALLIVFKLSSLTMFHYSGLTYYSIVFLTLVNSIAIVFPFIIIHLYVLTMFLSILLYFLTRDFLSIENNVVVMLEDLYSSVRQGFPIDSAVLRISSKYGFPIDFLSNLIKLGFRVKSIVRVFKIPLFTLRVFNLILAPIEYSYGFPRYLGYVMNIVDNIRSLRRILFERSKLYYMYVFILFFVTIIVFKLMCSIGYGRVSVFLIKGLIYSSTFESIIIASTISCGYWFRSKAFYTVLTTCLVLSLLLL